MTDERRRHLLSALATITERAELIGFIRGLKAHGEYTSEMAVAVRDHADRAGWK